MCQGYLMTATITTQQQKPMLGLSMAQPLVVSKKFSFETCFCDIIQLIYVLSSLIYLIFLCCTFIGMFTIYNNNNKPLLSTESSETTIYKAKLKL